MGAISTVTPLPEFIVTCEHGGNNVPGRFADAFGNKEANGWLASHRGYDPGALAAAEQLAAALQVDLISSTTTRLLVDLNRSLGTDALFSKFTRDFAETRKSQILDQYYHPYRRSVVSSVNSAIRRGRVAIHLSVHTFTPRIAGKWRPIDIGLLFDPGARGETDYSTRWSQRLAAQHPNRRILLNQPYAGVDDGLTTALRKEFRQDQYFGIEIEINNRYYKRSPQTQAQVVGELIGTVLPRSRNHLP